MLTQRVDLFDSTYGHFTEAWLTVEEYDRFISWLRISPEQHVLEVASGSGGPALYLADRTS